MKRTFTYFSFILCWLFPQLCFSYPVQNFIYLLQADQINTDKNIVIQKLKDSNADLIILDAYFSTTNKGKWTSQDLQTIRSGKKSRKIIVYLSIGEAENYRNYWKKNWSPQQVPFLLKENPHWKGNFKVKYWHPLWQKIILQEVQSQLKQGFDGFYLDIIDAFEYFEATEDKYEDDKQNPETHNSYRQDMKNWVLKIAQISRQQKPQTLIIPQNGSQLLKDPNYLASIDNIGIEDLFFIGDKKQSKEHTQYILSFLKNLPSDKKPLIIEYGKKKFSSQSTHKRARELNWPLLITARALNTIK